MGMNRPMARPGWREVAAIDLAALVQRHGAGFGRVRDCGDWSERRFRQFCGPLLLAFARHAHLLPSAPDAPCGSLLEVGLDACARSVLAEAAGGASPSRIDRQEAVALRALSPWTVSAARRWQVSSREGKSIVLGGEPLADQLDAANRCAGRSVPLPVYRIAPAAVDDLLPQADASTPGLAIGARMLGIVLLLRAVPPTVLASACAASPALLESALESALEFTLESTLESALEPHPVPASVRPGAAELRVAMHALIAEGQWTVNARRSRLWHLDGRLFLVWKTASKELSGRLAIDPTLLLPALIEHRIVRVPAVCAQTADRGPVDATLLIRTPHTDALPVVELAAVDEWLRSRPVPDAAFASPEVQRCA
jgi:hypothetical protein